MTIIEREQELVPSLAFAESEELASLEEKTARERAWYADYPRFPDADAIDVAAKAGQLVFVGPDDNILPIARLRNPELDATYPPYMLPQATFALKAIGRIWRTEMVNRDLDDPSLRISVSYLARSERYQQMLVEDPTKLAVPDSTHCVGAAFDIDASAYYRLIGDSTPQSVVHPGRTNTMINSIVGVLHERVSNDFSFVRGDGFDPNVPQVLVDISEKLHQDGMINRILEFPGSHNQCLHIAPNPEVTATDWQSVII